MIKYVTGIGSRKTPDPIKKLMYAIAAIFELNGFRLRSGGADGADTAFEHGSLSVGGTPDIFLHEKLANGHPSPLFTVCADALQLAQASHPAWDACGKTAKLLHARNCYQVLGQKLDTPSECLVCWTPDGCINALTRSLDTGGTATAIVIAALYDIPIFNLRRANALEQLEAWCQSKGFSIKSAIDEFHAPAQGLLLI